MKPAPPVTRMRSSMLAQSLHSKGVKIKVFITKGLLVDGDWLVGALSLKKFQSSVFWNQRLRRKILSDL
jgi:hypothetical protein